jgi:tetratricopeptide (TPR) repeat protein
MVKMFKARSGFGAIVFGVGVLLGTAKFVSAEPVFVKITEGIPTAIVANNEGIAAMEKKEYAAALAAFEKAVAIAPQAGVFYNNRGVAFSQLGDDKRALEDYEKALRLSPGNDVLHVNRAFSLYNLKEYGAALSDVNRAIAINPNLPAAYHARGIILHAQGLKAQALADFDKAILLEPGKAHFYVDRGLTHLGEKAWQLAGQDFNEAIRLDPANVTAYSGRARAALNIGEYAFAVTDSDEALKLKPNDAELLKTRGRARHALSRWSDAIADYEAAWRLEPTELTAIIARERALRREPFDGATADLLATVPSPAPQSGETRFDGLVQSSENNLLRISATKITLAAGGVRTLGVPQLKTVRLSAQTVILPFKDWAWQGQASDLKAGAPVTVIAREVKGDETLEGVWIGAKQSVPPTLKTPPILPPSVLGALRFVRRDGASWIAPLGFLAQSERGPLLLTGYSAAQQVPEGPRGAPLSQWLPDIAQVQLISFEAAQSANSRAAATALFTATRAVLNQATEATPQSTDYSGDVLAFTGEAPKTALPIFADEKSVPGAPLWIVGLNQSSRVPTPVFFAAQVVFGEENRLLLRHNRSAAGALMSGAPVLNLKGEIVGITAGLLEVEGAIYVMANPVSALRRRLLQTAP